MEWKNDKRKFLGMFLGIVMYICMIIIATYSYYSWKSEDTLVTLNLSDSYFYCESDIDILDSNLSPVLDYRDGTYQTFKVNNVGGKDTSFSLNLNISNVDESLLTDSFKYKLVVDKTGGSNNCADISNNNCVSVGEGNFSTFKEGMNTLIPSVELVNNSKYQYYLFMYIDGNMENDVSMQNSSMTATLGVCEIVLYFDANGGSVSPEFIKLVSSVTQYPTLPTPTKNNSTITYNYNGATGGNSTTSEVVSYIFGGWYKSTDTSFSTPIEEGDVIDTTTNLILKAKWNLSKTLTLPTPTKTGYTFEGWYSDSELTQKIGNAGDTYNPSKSITLYAKWEPNTYTVTLNNQSATTAGTTTVYYQYNTTKIVNGVTAYYYTDSALTTPLTNGYTITKPVKTGYTYGGYYTETNGGGTQYVDTSGNFVNNLYKNFTTNSTLYAKWTAKTYTVQYSCGTGSGTPPTTQTATYDQTFTVASNICTKTGYTFAGWNDPTGASWTGWSGTWKYDNGQHGISDNTLTLTAQWTPNTYTVQYSCGTGSGTPPTTQTATYDQTFTVASNTCTKTGYTFSKWTDPTGDNGWTGWSGTWKYVNGQYGISNNTLTLTAQWTANNYTIAYTLNGGTKGTNAPTSGTYDTDVQISNPTKTVTVTGNVNGTGATISGSAAGVQTFAGWTSSSSAGLGSNAKTGTTASPSTAWSGSATKNTYFRNLRDTSGTVTLTAAWTAVAFNLPTVTKTGYTCTWNTASNGSGTSYNSGASYTPSTTSAAAITLYAVCTVNSYTLTVNPNSGSYNGTTSNTTVTQNYNTTYGLLTPSKTGYSLGSWSLSGSGTLMRGSAAGYAPTIGHYTRTSKTDTDGSAYTNYSFNQTNSGSGYIYPGIKFSNYSYTSGHTYRISVMIRNKTASGLSWFILRHSALTNDWGSTGIVSRNITVSSNWVEYTMERTFTGTTTTLGENTVNISPCFEIYAAVAAGNTGVIDLDVKNLTIYDVTAGNYISSNEYGGYVYRFGAGNGTTTANWTANKYTVNYNCGTGSGTPPSSQTATYDQTFTVASNTCTKTGYTFSGWSDPTGDTSWTGWSGTWKYVNGQYGISDNKLTLTAQWSVNSYTMTYQSNLVANGDFSLGSVAWNLGSFGTIDSSVKYSGLNSARIRTTSSGFDGIRTLLGVTYKANTKYRISLKAYRDSSSSYGDLTKDFRVYVPEYKSDGTVYSYRHYITINSSNLPNKTWTSYSADFTTAASGTAVSFSGVYLDYRNVSGTSNIWVTDIKLEEIQTQTKEYGSALGTLPTVSRTGYTFGGWFTGENGTGTQITTSTTVPASNPTYYAKWTPNIYKVTLNNQSATTAGTTEYYYQLNTYKTVNGVTAYYYTTSALTTPLANGYTITKPTKTGYTFGGYYTGTNGSGTQYVDGNGNSVNNIFHHNIGNITLYAKWTANQYTVTYDCTTNGGSTSNSTASVAYGSSVDLTKTCSKSNWTFVGWNTNKDATTALSSYTMPANNVTLYAIYKKTVTVTFNNNGCSSSNPTASKTIYNNATSVSVTTPTAPTMTSAWSFVGYNTSNTATTGTALEVA